MLESVFGDFNCLPDAFGKLSQPESWGEEAVDSDSPAIPPRGSHWLVLAKYSEGRLKGQSSHMNCQKGKGAVIFDKKNTI